MRPAFSVLLTEVFHIQSLIVSHDDKRKTVYYILPDVQHKTLIVVNQNSKNSRIICQNMPVKQKTLLINDVAHKKTTVYISKLTSSLVQQLIKENQF